MTHYDMPDVHGRPLYLCGIIAPFDEPSDDGAHLAFAPTAFGLQASVGRWRRGVKVTPEHYSHLTVADADRVEIMATNAGLLFRCRLPASPQGQVAAVTAAHPACGASIIYTAGRAPANRVLRAELLEIGLTHAPAWSGTCVWRSDVDPDTLPRHARAGLAAMHLADMADRAPATEAARTTAPRPQAHKRAAHRNRPMPARDAAALLACVTTPPHGVTAAAWAWFDAMERAGGRAMAERQQLEHERVRGRR